MDCCAHTRGLNTIFDEQNARNEVKEYWKKGIDKHARVVVDAVGARGVAGATLLEVGGGIGGLHAELLKRGAERATNVDISSAYISAAQSVAEKLGLQDRVEHRLADFAREADSVPAADVVILHRVVCCYPDMPRLVTTASQHANRLLALTFPCDAWYMRLFEKLGNVGLWLTRSNFRFFVHSPEAILSVAAESGLKPVQQKFSRPWQIVIFERAT
ncbi:MAG: methyltransferase domain-containing protein [Chloroflexi bacterium]|nr:methyltransferase domain-containing protein [Chloroflexota bacterium]